MKSISLPLSKKDISALKVGDCVYLSGTILTARDCAHKRLFELLDSRKNLPFDIKDTIIYYAGPCPAKPDVISGSCGPTTSARMNVYAPRLLDLGLGAIIGKGEMSDTVRNAVKRNKSVYFAAVGGAGALYASCITHSECIAFEDLLSEAIYKLEVKDFPVIVAYDSFGNSIY